MIHIFQYEDENNREIIFYIIPLLHNIPIKFTMIGGSKLVNTNKLEPVYNLSTLFIRDEETEEEILECLKAVNESKFIKSLEFKCPVLLHNTKLGQVELIISDFGTLAINIEHLFSNGNRVLYLSEERDIEKVDRILKTIEN